MKRIIIFFLIIVCFSCKQAPKNKMISGPVFGTSYSVVYESKVDFETQFDSIFYKINKSMSTYQVNSNISKLNRNEPVTVDDHFIKVYETSKKIYEQTNGVFDPTIGAIVNAWDFGPENNIVELDSVKIDSLMTFVGFDKVNRIDDQILKLEGTFLDFNAIAKGYGVDMIAEFLDSQNIENYLVEIGGEIRVKGRNTDKRQSWKVGVEQPRFDGKQAILKTIDLNRSMATSGTYRKFKIDDNGNRYAHIINTKTGYPSKTNVLSVSVIADNCMIADAYATAFQAMKIEQITEFLNTHPELKVFLIFENKSKKLETLALNNFPED